MRFNVTVVEDLSGIDADDNYGAVEKEERVILHDFHMCSIWACRLFFFFFSFSFLPLPLIFLSCYTFTVRPALSALRQTHACSKSNASTAKPMAFALSHTLASTSGTISPKTSGTLLLSLPSKANSRHFSSQNISIQPHCSSLLSVVCVCVCVRERERERERVCVCVCVCVRERESVCVCVCVCMSSTVFKNPCR